MVKAIALKVSLSLISLKLKIELDGPTFPMGEIIACGGAFCFLEGRSLESGNGPLGKNPRGGKRGERGSAVEIILAGVLTQEATKTIDTKTDINDFIEIILSMKTEKR